MRNELKDKQIRQIECIGPLNIFCIMGRGASNMTFTFYSILYLKPMGMSIVKEKNLIFYANLVGVCRVTVIFRQSQLQRRKQHKPAFFLL